MPKRTIRDNGKRSDPETAAIIRKELERHRAAKPEPPPPTPEQLAYYAALKSWRAQEEALRGNLYAALRKRYEVVEVGSLFVHVWASTDSKTEARQLCKSGEIK